MMKFITILFITVLFIACSKDDGISSSTDAMIVAWLDTMNISATRDDVTGIYFYADSLNPTGTPVSAGNVAAIYYTLSDLNGNVIASHQRADGDSLLFLVGASAVYPVGIDASVTQMRSGEGYHFILPPEQAYSQLTSGAIDPNLIAHLHVQLVAVFTENDLFAQESTIIQQYVADNQLDSTNQHPVDPTVLFPASGIVYKRRAIGSGALPLNGDTLIVDYTTRLIDDTPLGADTGFQWIYGSDQPRALLPGFEFGVSLMQRGEQALIIVPSSQAYRESALIIPSFITSDLIADGIIPDYVQSVPPYQPLLFEITRVN